VFAATILALALTSQAPQAPTMDAEPAAPAPARARETARGARAPYRSAAERKAILRRQVAEQERRDAIAAQRYQAEARAQYERMLPYMLENQRQAYNRMSQLERNAIAQQNADTYRQSMMWLQWEAMRRPR
jgi:hypothetical protein